MVLEYSCTCTMVVHVCLYYIVLESIIIAFLPSVKKLIKKYRFTLYWSFIAKKPLPQKYQSRILQKSYRYFLGPAALETFTDCALLLCRCPFFEIFPAAGCPATCRLAN